MTPRNAHRYAYLCFQDGLYYLIEAPTWALARTQMRARRPTGVLRLDIRYPGMIWFLGTRYGVKLERWTAGSCR